MTMPKQMVGEEGVKPFGDAEKKKLQEVGAEADKILADENTEEKPVDGNMDADVKEIADALGISEGGAKKILESAKKDPELKDLPVKELIQRLIDEPMLQMDLMKEGSGSDEEPSGQMVDYGMSPKE